MKDKMMNHTNCYWRLRFEIIGVILLVIATLLTVITMNGIGIAALFASGVILCLFNRCCSYLYSSDKDSCPVCHDAGTIESKESKVIKDNKGNDLSKGQKK